MCSPMHEYPDIKDLLSDLKQEIDIKKECYELRKRGYPVPVVAEKLGISIRSVTRYYNQHKATIELGA
jgi:hypothetical protein